MTHAPERVGRFGAAAKTATTAVVLALLLIFSLRFTAKALPSAVAPGISRLSALTVMLSGSRGILSELLWWRIGELQRQNRYTETAVLTDWLLALEPSSPEVRVFNAWNLAYNISVAHDIPEDRWFWVCRGITLLEEGVSLFPEDSQTMRQLGWIFEDKIGGDLDVASPYYRAHLTDILPPDAARIYPEALGLPPGTPVDARLCALYWYERAGDTVSTLRILAANLMTGSLALWAEPFVRAATPIWEDLAPSQQAQIASLLRDILNRGDSPSIRRFLEEHSL